MRDDEHWGGVMLVTAVGLLGWSCGDLLPGVVSGKGRENDPGLDGDLCCEALVIKSRWYM